MEQCMQMLMQAIQSGQLDPQTPIGTILEQMGGAQEPAPEQGLMGAAPQPQAPQGM